MRKRRDIDIYVFTLRTTRISLWVCQAEELQAIAVYLAGDISAFTTGSDFIIDGAFICI